MVDREAPRHKGRDKRRRAGIGLVALGAFALCLAAVIDPKPGAANAAGQQDMEHVDDWFDAARGLMTRLSSTFEGLGRVRMLAERTLAGEVSPIQARRQYRDTRARNLAALREVTAQVDTQFAPPATRDPRIVSGAEDYLQALRDMARDIERAYAEADQLFEQALQWDRGALGAIDDLTLARHFWMLRGEVIVAEMSGSILGRENPDKPFYRAVALTNTAALSMSEMALDAARSGGMVDPLSPNLQQARQALSDAEAALESSRRQVAKLNRKLERRAKRQEGLTPVQNRFGPIFQKSIAQEQEFSQTVRKLIDFVLINATNGGALAAYDAFYDHLPTFIAARKALEDTRRRKASQVETVLDVAPPRETRKSESAVF